jgi:cysteine synthase A
MARAVIERAADDGRLQPGFRVVEYTGGSTVPRSHSCVRTLGYRLHIVTSDAFSPEKLDQMAALGAELTLVPSQGRSARPKKLILRDMIETARALSQEPRTYWVVPASTISIPLPDIGRSARRFGGRDAGERRTPSCIAPVRGRLVTGVATILKPAIVRRCGSSSSNGGGPRCFWAGEAGPHKIEGVGHRLRAALVGKRASWYEVLAIPTEAAKEMTRRLAREEVAVRGNVFGRQRPGGHRSRQTAWGRAGESVTLMVDFGIEVLEYGRLRAPLTALGVRLRAVCPEGGLSPCPCAS